MCAQRTPIGFEALLNGQDVPSIGFEQYENGFSQNSQLVYPIENRMPIPNMNSYDHRVNSDLMYVKKLSSEELSSIYREIVDFWFLEKWLKFVDNQEETFLTLSSETNSFSTVQTAIDRHLLVKNKKLIFEPEIFLIRTESTSRSIFLANENICLKEILSSKLADRTSSYKLMSMICYADEIDGNVMFHRHFPSDSWYFYKDQSSSSIKSSNRLSRTELDQLNNFLAKHDQTVSRETFEFPLYPFSSLYNHPITYVYIIEKNPFPR